MPSRRALALLPVLLCAAATAWSQTYLPHFDPNGSGPTYTGLANGTTTAVPSLAAFALEGRAIELDGVLDDEAWQLAQTGWGFRQLDPDRGAPASVQSVFKVAYDDEAIYFAMACYEDDMANLTSRLSRRDEIEASDVVSIYIDPYHDRTTGYNFRVNAEGVLQDAYLFDNGDRDVDWDTVWEAEVSRDEHGWYVEMRIPFSAIRFKPADDMTWGLQAYRWLHGRGEDTGWVLWDRNASGFVSRWGTLTGLREVANPRKLEVLPYFVTKHTDPAAEGDADQWQNSQNVGADFKYGVTSNLTLNATFQPDFGQVEADPAVLNLSPFETFYQEKRPFFVEGARFFQHPDFRLFYYRRIGTGDPNSRIRGAAKLTGKIGGNLSLAVLAAATDIGLAGRAHNPFVGGTQQAFYGLVRVGREFNQGNHRVNLMGTTVTRNQNSFREAGERQQRNGYTGGLDFELNFKDRRYQVSGSTVGTLVDPFADKFDPALSGEASYGTGGRLHLAKNGGRWRGSVTGRWESDKLDPNDMGFLSAPDEKIIATDLSYHYDRDGKDSAFNAANASLTLFRSWFYAGNSGRDLTTDAEIWAYEAGHDQSRGLRLSAFAQHRSFHQGWLFFAADAAGTDKYATRTFDNQRGPLMTRPERKTIAASLTTDWRRALSLRGEISRDFGDSRRGPGGSLRVIWHQNQHFQHELGVGISHKVTDAQWLGNFANTGSRPGIVGIGGVDYVFAELDQMTWDLTLRSSVLFDRDRSLQLYVQPFLTSGDYTNPRYLATADSYDLREYTDFAAGDHDFNFGAVNLNLVYRWEYRPGSTVFLVWTHSKQRYESRATAGEPDRWGNDFNAGFPFGVEPGNTFLLKFNYWFSI